MTALTLTRTLQSSPQRVWRAWTDGAEFTSWFWPARFETVGDVDARVGGRWRLASPVAGIGVSGEFAAVEPPSRLVFTWRWDADETETLVTVTFADSGDGGTILTVVHERFDSAEEAASHEEGWNDCLARLAPFVGGA